MARRPARSAAQAAPPAEVSGAAPEAVRIVLPDALDSRAAPGLLKALRAARGAPLALDGSGVKKMGGRCAQVLLSAALSWRADGRTLALADPSPEFVEALRLLGLAPESLVVGGPAS